MGRDVERESGVLVLDDMLAKKPRYDGGELWRGKEGERERRIGGRERYGPFLKDRFEC